MIAIAMLAVGDAALMWTGLGQAAGASWWFVPSHLALTCAAWWIARRDPETAAGWANLALPLGAVAGPCGIALLYLTRTAASECEPALEDDGLEARRRPAAFQSSNPMTNLARTLDDRIRFPPAERIEPLGTILRHGDLAARRRALEAAVRSFEPRLSSLVATALGDEDQTIRSLAAAAAAQASSNLARQLAALEGDSGSADGSYALAMFLFDHGCHNVLLPRSQRVELRHRACEVLAAFERLAPPDDRRRKSVLDALAVVRAELVRAEGKRRPPILRSVENAA